MADAMEEVFTQIRMNLDLFNFNQSALTCHTVNKAFTVPSLTTYIYMLQCHFCKMLLNSDDQLTNTLRFNLNQFSFM